MSATAPSAQQVWDWLCEVPDPEIPALSVVDLGIVREVGWEDNDECVVTITPTYSGCPAMPAISDSIDSALKARGIARVRLKTCLSPAWTTDWLSEQGRQRLKDFGIAPPACRAGDPRVIDISRLRRDAVADRSPACPRCGSSRTHLVSQFGSTPCKALHVCEACGDPFDHFKPH